MTDFEKQALREQFELIPAEWNACVRIRGGQGLYSNTNVANGEKKDLPVISLY